MNELILTLVHRLWLLNLPRSGLVQLLFGRIRLSRTEALGCPPK